MLGHLTPFVVALAAQRVHAGEVLTPELVLACVRQAVDEDNARCLRWSGIDTQGYRMEDARTVAIEALSRSVYDAIPRDGAPQWNPRWLACAAEKGISPDALTNQEYLCWRPRAVQQNNALRPAPPL